MTYIKILTALAGLALLIACGGTALPIDAPTLAGAEPTALEIQSNGRK